MSAVIGIDPGATGAAALLIDGKYADLLDFVPDSSTVDTLRTWATLDEIELTALERVHAMPKQGVTSTFTFGTHYGWWRGVLDALGGPWLDVRPQEWAKGILPRKKVSTAKPGLPTARRLFPGAELHLAKHHNRADALLIAWWAWRQLKGE